MHTGGKHLLSAAPSQLACMTHKAEARKHATSSPEAPVTSALLTSDPAECWPAAHVKVESLTRSAELQNRPMKLTQPLPASCAHGCKD